MRFQRLRLLAVFGGVTALAACASFLIGACSETAADVAVGDAGSDVTTPSKPKPATDSGRVNEPDSGTPHERCVAACDATHPGAAAKEAAIDTCWSAFCNAPCVDQSSAEFDAGDDAGGDAGSDGGAGVCGTSIGSGVSRSCDDCTAANCCTSWRGCFDDPDCNAYDSCLADCLAAP